MAQLDDALAMKMSDIVNSEHRPFSYLDFVPSFSVDGESYSIAYGTFRNKAAAFLDEQLIEVAYRSKQTFYTLKGVRFGRKNQILEQISDDPLSTLIRSLPVEQHALHDIRLRLTIPGIWQLLSSDSSLKMNGQSKDIVLPAVSYGNMIFTITIHRTDTISITSACSEHPIAADMNGLIALTEHLIRLEYYIQEAMQHSGMPTGEVPLAVPRYATWIVTMWHFGVDGAQEYTGEKFSTTVDRGFAGLLRIYTKDLKERGTRIRIERQEVPKKTFADAMEEKINGGLDLEG